MRILGPLRRAASFIFSPAVMSSGKFNVVFVLGGPGAGKGTQCAKIVQEFGFVHLSAGDLLREERQKEGSKVGELINEHIKNGSIVPVAITCSLLEKAMVKSGSNKFLIDGFPRNKDNLDGWQQEMGGKVNVRFVLFFDCPLDVCLNRCLSRGAAGSGRADDNVDSLKKRFETYMNSTMPIIEYYDKQGLVRKFDASGTPEGIFAQVRKEFESLQL